MTESIWETVEQEFNCEHPQCEIRYTLYSNKTRHYFRQCLKCGESIGTAIAHHKILEKDGIQPFDEELRCRKRREKENRRKELQQHRHAVWTTEQAKNRESYYAYLGSPQWIEKRRAILQRDNYVCQACLNRKATQAHHLTYDHIFDEPLFDLVAICDVCHDRLHGIELATAEIESWAA